MFIIDLLTLFYCFIAGKEIVKEKLEKKVVYEKPVVPEAHKNPDGSIAIENTLLYESDRRKYGALKACQWAKEGKYNLEDDELKKEKERCIKFYQNMKPA